MDILLVIAFLFFIGAIVGWCLEFLFRNLISHKGPRGEYFINPGFCTGPYLPIYGIGLSAMCIISFIVTEYIPEANDVVVIIVIAIVMNVIEFIGGFVLLKVFNMRLWDYRDRWGNIMGITCPLFALIWTAIGAVYYLVIHPYAIGWLLWLADHLAFSFFVGLFWGVFLIDLWASFYRASMIKEFADNHDVIVKYEELKDLIQRARVMADAKAVFFNQTVNAEGANVKASLAEHKDSFESKETAYASHRKNNK